MQRSATAICLSYWLCNLGAKQALSWQRVPCLSLLKSNEKATRVMQSEVEIVRLGSIEKASSKNRLIFGNEEDLTPHLARVEQKS